MRNSRNSLYKISNFTFAYPESSSKIIWNGEHNISSGEKILLTGSSGSGKSTLLYGLMGLLPDVIFGSIEGDILFNGKSLIADPNIIKGKAGLILQNPSSQMLCKSVKEELAFGLENKLVNSDDIIKKIHNWAEKFAITHILDRETANLSGGEKQKVTLISILLSEPDILLLDEPTAFLDPDAAFEFMNILNNEEFSNTMIFVEHNLPYLKKLINRNLHLDSSGKVIDRNANEINWQPALPHLPKIPAGENVIQLKNISFAYNKPLLKKINLDINAGEIITISGKNGCGKSTLLQIIAGLLKPDKGEISVSQNKSVSLKKMQEVTSILFQNPENHFLYNTVDKELIGSEIKYIDQEFAKKSSQSPYSLSEGEKRRLSTAIACQRNKKVLLMDEPTFGQDIDNKKNLIELLNKLRNDGMAIVIVSHDIAFTKSVSTRHFILKNGKLDHDNPL